MLCRVADSLFWMSRYLERAENQARFIDKVIIKKNEKKMLMQYFLKLFIKSPHFPFGIR